MNLSARVEYACIAMLDLAVQYHVGQPIQQRKMSERHSISPQFLVQILHQLKTAQLVTSTRGAAGGYRLARAPNAITLWDVVSAVSAESDRHAFRQPESSVANVLRDVWKALDHAQEDVLKTQSLAELAGRVGGPNKPMYYI